MMRAPEMDAILNDQDPRMQSLQSSGCRYSFFQALRDVEAAHSHLPRIGHTHSPVQETYRIRQSAELTFASSTISSLKKNDQGQLEIDQRFFGLLGPSGPFPLHLTEMVRNRARHANDDALQAFLDIFHHRMASLFYRAWSGARAVVQRDRPHQDRFATFLLALSGNGLRSSRNRDDWDDDSKAFFSGHLGSLRRNAEGLESILRRLTGTCVSVQSFALQWLDLPVQERTCLGDGSQNVRGRNASCLGRSTVVGSRVADRQSSIEVRLGPMPYASFAKCLPQQPWRSAIGSVLHHHVGISIDAKVRLVLRKEEIPRPQLGTLGQLGRNAWIQSRPIDSDRDDYEFSTKSNHEESLDPQGIDPS